MEINNYINPILKSNAKDYCTVCGKQLSLKGLNKISHCNNELCKISSKHIVIDNKITDMYKRIHIYVNY